MASGVRWRRRLGLKRCPSNGLRKLNKDLARFLQSFPSREVKKGSAGSVFTRKLTDVKHKLIVCARFTRMSPERFEDLLTLVGIAFDRPDRLSRLRAFPCNRFKIYTIVPIVRIELNSIQAIEVASVVRVVCDRLDSICI